MLRPVTARLPLRSGTRQILRVGQRHQRRWNSFAPPSQKTSSFRGTLLRWGIAAGGVWWYMSSGSDVFAEDARGKFIPRQLPETQVEDENLPTVDSVVASRREKERAVIAESPPSSQSQTTANPTPQVSSESSQPQSTSSSGPNSRQTSDSQPSTSASQIASPEPSQSQDSTAALEQEAHGEGAFNEETGEINWDCPCLGGMAHGPCGTEFREAFSCFVYSKEEPKGVDCIERFKTMQDCFRQHPDVYGSELTDDLSPEEEEEARAAGQEAAQREHQTQQSQKPSSESSPQEASAVSASPDTATAPYSGASTPSKDIVSEHNLTSTPSAHPADVAEGPPAIAANVAREGSKEVGKQ